MPLNQMRQTVSDNPDINRMQDALNEQFRQLSQVSIVNGLLLSGVALSTSQTNVQHKLGRTPQGYIVVSRSSNATVYNGTFTDTVLPLTASAGTTVSLWVF